MVTYRSKFCTTFLRRHFTENKKFLFGIGGRVYEDLVVATSAGFEILREVEIS